WISSPEARQLGHRLRDRHDAVLVGATTVERDDPALTVRLDDGHARQPLRVVVDSTLRTSPQARLFHAGEGQVVIATTAAASAERTAALRGTGAEVVVLPDRDGRVDLAALLDHLGSRQVLS